MAGTQLRAADFKKLIAETAAALRRRIEAEVTGLDDSPGAVAQRRAKALAPDGYRFFVETYFPHYIRGGGPSRLHAWLFERLPTVINRAGSGCEAIAAPRGEAKSTLCSQLLPLWTTARAVKHYVIIAMDAFDQAALMVEAIKAELEANPRLALDFPEMCGQGRLWREGVIVTANGVKIEAVGSGKRLRGRRHGPHRPDLVVLDDIENDENVRSPDQRNKLESWIDKAVGNLGGAGGGLDQIFIGTILHYDSVLARKLRHPLWHGVKFQSVIRWPDRLDLWERWREILANDGAGAAESFRLAQGAAMTEGAEVSWPGVRPFPDLMILRARIGDAAFDSEQQNDPISESDALFGKITFWVERQRDWIFLGACDPSLGKANKGRDPSALLVGGFSRETGKLDVIEALIRRRLPDLIIEDIIALQAEYHCLRWAVESVQFQEFFRTELVKRSAARGVPVPAVPVVPIADKSLRIERLQPHVANGLIRLSPAQTGLIDQMRHYPLVDHDDGVDALEMLWTLAVTGAGQGKPMAARNGRTTAAAISGYLGGQAGERPSGVRGAVGLMRAFIRRP
jgi:predicted phage terminase large subunit-like protein